MKGLMRLEFKKFVNTNNSVLIIIFILVIISSIISVSKVDVIDNNGNFYSGLGGWRILDNQARVSDGFVTKDYMMKEKRRYDKSYSKPYIEGTSKEDRKLGLKLTYPQDSLFFTLNVPYGEDVLTAYNDMNLTEVQMQDFYENWPRSVIEVLKRTKSTYSEKEYQLIYSKSSEVETPFYYAYNMGWQAFSNSLEQTWWLYAIFLSVLFASVFEKHSTFGLSEIILYNPGTRKSLYHYKLSAQLIMGTVVYLIYILSILLVVGIIYGLHGWNASIQFFDSLNIFSIVVWQGVLFKLLIGLFTTFLYIYLVSFLSLLFKSSKATITIFILQEVLLSYKVNGLAETYSFLYNLIPRNFLQGIFSTSKLYFIGTKIIPYGFVALLLACLYIFILRSASRFLLKNYYI